MLILWYSDFNLIKEERDLVLMLGIFSYLLQRLEFEEKKEQVPWLILLAKWKALTFFFLFFWVAVKMNIKSGFCIELEEYM